MNLKSIILTALTTLSLSALIMAQTPNYVPAAGLVGWWPFNGNANDESGNGNNGAVNGATLTTDRFGNLNQAYNFNGTNSNQDYIICNNPIPNQDSFSISYWISRENTLYNKWHLMLTDSINFTGSYELISYKDTIYFRNWGPSGLIFNLKQKVEISDSTFFWVCVTSDNNNTRLIVNGVQVQQTSTQKVKPISGNLYIGKHSGFGGNSSFSGKLDDIGIWNRALTQQEITHLYNSVECANNTTITPQTNTLTTGSVATFIVTSSDSNPNYVWQSDFGQGFQTLNNYGNYSGSNTATLNIANVQLSEHNQPFRAITISGNCVDTSNVAMISILDTCIVTVYDTLLTSITDTLVINTKISGINPPNNLNTLKVYPNPANTHITINYGNFNVMNGYTITIVNSIGQTVFITPINQQLSYIDLSTWTGTGIYFVQLIDPQNNIIENKKIVIQ